MNQKSKWSDINLRFFLKNGQKIRFSLLPDETILSLLCGKNLHPALRFVTY